jgi:pimeloyl-ACP methyl ester carboxylesterase
MHKAITRRDTIALVAAATALLPAASCARTRGIDETGFVRIGGIDQWIAIRGSDVSNPVMLYLHGGPGEAQSPFLKNFAPWETEYTVVNWDQRGSGRTYGRNGAATPGMSTPEMALDTLCKDVRELADHVRKRLSREKIILVGQSWGAELGLHVVKRWPDLFHAFVGTGQPVSWTLKIEAQERWARAQAITAGDQATLKALDDTASLPMTDRKRTMASARYRLGPDDLQYVKGMDAFIGPPPPPTQGEVADWIAGGNFTFPRLAPIEYAFDARQLGLDFSLPFFVIQGQDDRIAPFEVARAYVAEVRAPQKAFIPIAGGHWACFTNPAAFLAGLRSITSSRVIAG